MYIRVFKIKEYNKIEEKMNELKTKLENIKNDEQEYSNMNKLMNIQVRLLNYDGLMHESGNRKYIKEGHLMLITNLSQPSSSDKKLCFLFTDIMLVTEFSAGNKLKVRNTIPLAHLTVVDVSPLHFMLIENRTFRTLLFEAPKNIHKRRWLLDLQQTISSLLSSNGISYLSFFLSFFLHLPFSPLLFPCFFLLPSASPSVLSVPSFSFSISLSSYYLFFFSIPLFSLWWSLVRPLCPENSFFFFFF